MGRVIQQAVERRQSVASGSDPTLRSPCVPHPLATRQVGVL